jgi:hypothetical protein
MALVTPQVNHRDPKQPSFILSQPPSDARFSGACASQCPPANFSTNTPTDEGDVPALASVTVEDPHHPLFGRSFRVLGFAPPSTVGLSPSYEVKYLHGISLLVPVAATVRPDRLEKQTKLSVEALRDLISLIELLDAHDDRAERPLVDTSRGATAADHRPDCRRADGDAP